jgi:sterol desaturase/sphingolipid hydroxylase (fatty acid hydroxylase superfamily)
VSPWTLAGNALAAVGFFVAADLVYTLDHYLVHHDRERYRLGHARHHRRYIGRKDAPQLDAYELATYGSAALVSFAAMSAVALFTGLWGLAIGAALKLVHSLLFHCYQHRWWSQTPIGRQEIARPRRGWGLATAAYHAHHHARPDDAVFTYSETWQGFDRILERLHPWLVRHTQDGRRGEAIDRTERLAVRRSEAK